MAEASPNQAVCGLLDAPLMSIHAPAQEALDETEHLANSVMLAHDNLLHDNAERYAIERSCRHHRNR